MHTNTFMVCTCISLVHMVCITVWIHTYIHTYMNTYMYGICDNSLRTILNLSVHLNLHTQSRNHHFSIFIYYSKICPRVCNALNYVGRYKDIHA